MDNISVDGAIMAWINEANDHHPYFPRKVMMSVGMLELSKGLLYVGKCSNTELDMILFGDISMHNNGLYFNQGSE